MAFVKQVTFELCKADILPSVLNGEIAAYADLEDLDRLKHFRLATKPNGVVWRKKHSRFEHLKHWSTLSLQCENDKYRLEITAQDQIYVHSICKFATFPNIQQRFIDKQFARMMRVGPFPDPENPFWLHVRQFWFAL